jgi:hypothetical protein
MATTTRRSVPNTNRSVKPTEVQPNEPGYNTMRSLNTVLHTSLIAMGIMILPPLTFADVNRLVKITDDDPPEIESRNTEPNDRLASLLISSLDLLTVDGVSPVGSVTFLFHPEGKKDNPNLFLAYGLNNGKKNPSICGALTLCEWQPDKKELSTNGIIIDRKERLSIQEYLMQTYQLRLQKENTLFIDIVVSKCRGTGSLLVLSAYLKMMRSRKYNSLAAMAVTAEGNRLFEGLGFTRYEITERRTLWHIKKGQLNGQQVQQRLHWNDLKIEWKTKNRQSHQELLKPICWRHSPKSKTGLVSRC